MLQVGQRVKYSGYVLQKKRDYWNQCGREPMKSGAKAELDRATALRGTVIKVMANGVKVKTDDGSEHQSLSYLWVSA